MNKQKELDARISSLESELAYLKSEKQKDHEKAIELADMIANANDVERIRVEHSAGDVYLLFAGENPNERLSFKLDRRMASDITCALDDTLQELDEEVLTKKQPEIKNLSHPEINELLRNIFGTSADERN